MSYPKAFVAAAVLCAALFPAYGAAALERRVPEPLAGHPGNVFLAGEEAVIEGPGGASAWVVEDVDGAAVAEGTGATARCTPGAGWYRVRFRDAAGAELAEVFCAVLEKLAAPTPEDSPICLDVATAWFASRYPDPDKTQPVLASLAALAGVNWTRDRLTWGELEPTQGVFAETGPYDASAERQAAAGLQVLQVFHHTPPWAMGASGKRLPPDLRHVYRFGRAMAERFEGRVLAWEPWNEADIVNFGGHTIAERCAYQKAAYLGFKVGSPDLTVCWNVNALPDDPYQAEGVFANEAWPYFDTFNAHTYAPPETYEDQFEPARDSASGRPLWLTECGTHMRIADLDSENPLWEEALRQASFIPRSYASSLFAGVARHFFFLLPHYAEGSTQFGLCRRDMTPRPGYVALAAAGRLLAGAEPLGRLGHGFYAFRAMPDGRARDMVVVWGAEWQEVLAQLPLDDAETYDHFGRRLETARPQPGEDAIYVVMPVGALRAIDLDSPRDTGSWRGGEPSAVVLQADLSGFATRLGDETHEIAAGREIVVPIHVYNFGAGDVSGTLDVESLPGTWDAAVTTEALRVAPMDRGEAALRVTLPASGSESIFGGWLKLRGAFGDAGSPALAVRFAATPAQVEPAQVRPLPFSNDPARWEDNVMQGAAMDRRPAADGGVAFHMRFAETDPWGYPRLPLPEDARPETGDHGLALTLELAEGPGAVRVQFIEADGAAYLAETNIGAGQRGPKRVHVLFHHATWGPYSAIDPNGELDPAQISEVLVGVNAERDAEVTLVARDLAWVRY